MINWPSVKIYNSDLDEFFIATLNDSNDMKASYGVTVTLPSNHRPSPYLDSEDKVYEFDIYLNDILSSEKTSVLVKGEGPDYDFEWVVTTFDPDNPIVPHTGGTITFNIVLNGLPYQIGAEQSAQAIVEANVGEDDFIIKGVIGSIVRAIYPIGPTATSYFEGEIDSAGQIVVSITTGYALSENDIIKVTQIEVGKPASEVTIFTVGAPISPREDTPNIMVNFIGERINNFTTGERYCINGIDIDLTATFIDINPEWFGTTLTVIKRGMDDSIDSLPQSLDIPVRPECPIIGTVHSEVGENNGKLTGIIDGLEYRLNGTPTWLTPTYGTEVIGLAPGSYEIRVKSTSSSFASLPIEVVIEEGSTSPTDGWELTYSLTNVDNVVFVDLYIPLTEWSGYDGSQILDEDLWNATDPDTMHTKFYYKYPGQADWELAPFDAIVGLGTSVTNKLDYWGFYDGSIYVTGNNTTGGPIAFKVIKEG